jgi:hypothetical protein
MDDETKIINHARFSLAPLGGIDAHERNSPSKLLFATAEFSPQGQETNPVLSVLRGGDCVFRDRLSAYRTIVFGTRPRIHMRGARCV